MPGHVSNYSINTIPTTSGGGSGEAPDKSVLYWDATNNLIKGDSSFIFNDTLKKLTLVGSNQSTGPVTWTALVNGTASGGRFTKTGVDGWGASAGGAFSTQQITSGDGYVEWVLEDTAYAVMGGLSNGNPTADYNTIDFGLYKSGGNVTFYENGNLVGSSVAFTPGDIGRVEVSGGVVLYKVNGITRYTSLIAPTYPLNADCAIYSQNGTLDMAINVGAVTMQEWSNSSNVVKATMNDSGVLSLAALTASGDITSTAGRLLFSTDAILQRDAANILAQRNGTNAQSYRLYNTYTDASNYEMMRIGWSTNQFYLEGQQNGTGIGRGITISPSNSVLRVAGYTYPNADATYELGATTLRWKTGYFGGTAASIGLVVKAHASQTANLQEWQNSSGTALSSVGPTGNAGLGTTSPVTRLTVKAGTPAAEAVVWENMTNATAVGGTLTSTGYTGGGNGQQIGLAGGYVEHTWDGTVASVDMVGFATFSGRGNFTAAGTFYAYTYQPTGQMLIYENGVNVTTVVGLVTNDVVRIERTTANGMKYYINGVLKYTSLNTVPTSPLYVSCQILSSTGQVKNAMTQNYAVNIQEWRDNSAAIVARVDQSGDFFIKGLNASVVAKTTTYTVADTDHVVKCDATSAAFTVTLPPAGAQTGRLLHIKKVDSSANRITIDGNASELVEDAVTQQLIYQGENLMLQSDGTQWWVI